MFMPSTVKRRKNLRRIRSWWRRYIEFELSIVWWFRRDTLGRKISAPFRQIISRYPHRDISLMTWGGYVFGIYVLGAKFAVAAALNLGTVLVLRILISARRPIQYDTRIIQLSDRGPRSYGFPSAETHMAVFIAGSLAYRYRTGFQVLILTGAALYCFIVALSRVVAGSRFPHQVILSLATGLLGLKYTARFVHTKLPDWRGSWDEITKNRIHIILIVFASILGLALIAYSAEENSSYLFSIPKDEFKQVLQSVYENSKPLTPKRRTPSERTPHPSSAISLQQAPIQPDSLALLSARLSSSRHVHPQSISIPAPPAETSYI